MAKKRGMAAPPAPGSARQCLRQPGWGDCAAAASCCAVLGIYNLAYAQGAAMPSLSPPSRPKEAKLFRNNRSQAVRIPVEFELPGDRVLIHREGNKLVLEPVSRPSNIVELLAQWRQEPPLGPQDQFPDVDDAPRAAQDIF